MLCSATVSAISILIGCTKLAVARSANQMVGSLLYDGINDEDQ